MSEERQLARDTPLVAERAQMAAWRHPSVTARFAAFLDLHQTVIELAEAGIRLRHPEASDREVFLRRVARTLDAATMLRVYGFRADHPALTATAAACAVCAAETPADRPPVLRAARAAAAAGGR